MDIPTTAQKSKFDIAASICSACSVFGSVATLCAFFFPPERGIQFGTHMLLIFMFVIQLAVFVLFLFTAVILAGFSGGLRLSRLGAILVLIATAGFVSQFFAIQNVSVDGSSVP